MFASRRLKYRDYSAPGLYFVTVCSDFKHCTFGKVVDKKVELSRLGRIVEEAWLALSSRIFGIQLHKHVVMPNHIHGIVEISQQKLAQQAAPLQRPAGFGQEVRRTPSLSIIVRSLRLMSPGERELNWSGKTKSGSTIIFDRVIRDGREFANASRYIAENPILWQIQGQRLKADKEARRAQRTALLQIEPEQKWN